MNEKAPVATGAFGDIIKSMELMSLVRNIVLTGLLGLVGLAPIIVGATDYSSTNFKVNNPVINELGGLSTSTSFQLWSNVPYFESRTTTSTSYTNNPEFLNLDSTTTATSTSVSSTPLAGGSTGPYLPLPPKSKPPVGEKIRKKADFNNDGRVDIVDFSILLYYFDKEREQIERFDLNSDGRIDIVDISIFMYYWDDN